MNKEQTLSEFIDLTMKKEKSPDGLPLKDETYRLALREKLRFTFCMSQEDIWTCIREERNFQAGN